MLDVLKQFRLILVAIKRHYQWVERKCGVSGAQLWALGQIGETPGLTVNALAGELGIHQSTASNLLAKLTVAGLITRARLKEDQRVVRLFPTARGRSALRRAPQPFRGVLQQALSDLPAGGLNQVHRSMQRLLATMTIRGKPSASGTPLSDL
jgi:DNA-binding MarR family transcriptional regulator